ncbi:hypothetical protein V2J09_021252 [Rumex salicifolius]
MPDAQFTFFSILYVPYYDAFIEVADLNEITMQEGLSIKRSPLSLQSPKYDNPSEDVVYRFNSQPGTSKDFKLSCNRKCAHKYDPPAELFSKQSKENIPNSLPPNKEFQNSLKRLLEYRLDICSCSMQCSIMHRAAKIPFDLKIVTGPMSQPLNQRNFIKRSPKISSLSVSISSPSRLISMKRELKEKKQRL